MAFGFPFQRDYTLHITNPPSLQLPSPAVSHQTRLWPRDPWFIPGAQDPRGGRHQEASASSSKRPHFGKVILWRAGDVGLRQDRKSREGLEGGEGQGPRSLASERLWDGRG